MIVPSDGVDLHVEVHGEGDPVLLLHGWPDSGDLWRDQVPRLAGAGFRVIVPDLRGFGRSARPEGKDSYRLAHSAADMAAVLDAVGAPAAHVVGHDFGAALAWLIAMRLPGRVRTLTALSVPHPGTPEGMRQLEMAWYRLFFQFEGIAEATLEYDDWAALRALTPGYRDIDRAIANFSRPGALTASLNWYRANTAPRLPGPPRPLPPVSCPVLGVWSDGDRYLDGARMRASGELVSGPWRYAEITGASHWIPLDAPDELAALLLEWLGRPDQAVASGESQPALRSRSWRYRVTTRGPAEFLMTLPAGKRQPNLLFGAARYLLGESPDLGALHFLVNRRAGDLAGTMLARRTQTNEAARCATLLPALALLSPPLALIEVGASAGLTLLPDRYSYD